MPDRRHEFISPNAVFNMKRANRFHLVAALTVGLGLALTATTSCDTPKSIAWSYYYCAKDTLEAGDPYAAKHFLKSCKKTVDSELAAKADSLMEIIEEAMKEQKQP